MPDSPPGPVSRCDALRLLALSAAAPALVAGCRTPEEEAIAQHAAHRATGELSPAIGTKPGFFTEHEFETVRMLTDERLGDPRSRQTDMRGGLAWLDAQAQRAHGVAFVEATDGQRRALLDRIAYPDDADPSDAAGVRFFSRFRDYTAMGYFSSPAGVESIGYQGNVSVSQMGCSGAVQTHIGLTA